MSAWKLAVSLRRRLMFGPLHDRRRGGGRPLAYSVTLTCRSGDDSEVRAKLADLVRVVDGRAPRVGLLCALDLVCRECGGPRTAYYRIDKAS